MCKNKIYILFISFIVLFVTGCWDYRGLNEMIIVSGVAIDKLGDEYFLSFEIYDLQDTTTGEPIKTEIIQASGKTIFDAVRNAKKRTSNKLYFSESKILIISEEIAKEDGVNTMLNWFTRDPEIRETLRLVVSQEKTAFELLQTDSLTSNSVSSDIKDIVEKDSTVTGTTISTPYIRYIIS